MKDKFPTEVYEIETTTYTKLFELDLITVDSRGAKTVKPYEDGKTYLITREGNFIRVYQKDKL